MEQKKTMARRLRQYQLLTAYAAKQKKKQEP